MASGRSRAASERTWTVGRRAPATAAVALLLAAAACGKHPDPPPPAATPVPLVKPAPPTPIETKKEELGGTEWGPEWDKIVEQALSPAMLSPQVPRDVRRFCPRFYQMAELDKRSFWAYFFQALAGAEAGLEPTTRVQHPEVDAKDDVTGRLVRSEGLLQLTYEDQERYGCDFNWEKDRTLAAHDPAKTILQPKNNLECGVKILERQIIAQHKPLLASTGYWATLRPGGISYRVFAKQMTNVPAACGPRRHPPPRVSPKSKETQEEARTVRPQ
jgi:hypothetical protein